VRLFELACEQQDRAGAEQLYDRLRPVLSMMEDEGKYTQFVKAGCALVGHPVGPPRRPLLPPRPEDLRRLGQKLSALGIPAAPALDGWSGGALAADVAMRLSPSGDGEKGNH
jgi:4-hydroxy-tetrahydrodipicolinate synthase